MSVEKELVGNSINSVREMFESTPSCLKVIDKNGKLLSMNPSGIKLIEAPDEASVLGADVYDIVQEDHKEIFIQFNKKICAGEKGHLIFEIVGLEGTRRWMETYAAPYKLSNGELGHIAITNDITGKIKRQEEIENQKQALLSSSRLAALGEMAGGIAHEINNPLAIIMSKATQLKRYSTKNNINDETIAKGLTQIEETVQIISKVIKGLNKFSRDTSEDTFQQYSLVEIIKDTLDLTREKLKNCEIDLTLNLSYKDKIDCLPVQISQVLMNLLHNSFDGIRGLSEKWIHIDLFEEDEFVIIKITDSGKNLPHDIAEKIMHPFFTTKEIGQGTGLGLSISSSIIKNHNGTIILNSESVNTQFVITLPKSQPSIQ